jgi:multisubunit Na+/H+ antiporter MnhB subunit
MSARKLSRLAGLVFVLAAILGGVGAASAVVEHETGGTADTAVVNVQLIDVNWG